MQLLDSLSDSDESVHFSERRDRPPLLDISAPQMAPVAPPVPVLKR